MDQRRLRLGDTLDDYCPRERRVTNHAVVAMIEDEVKQTRCTTCDAEHVYKGARVPKRRKKESPATLFKDVLAGMPDADGAPALAAAPREPISDSPATPPALIEADSAPIVPGSNGAPAFRADAGAPRDLRDPGQVEEPGDTVENDDPEAPLPVEDGPVHRQLLRAKLPRPEGQKDARPIPEFTVRQAASRTNGQFRGGDRSRPRGGDPRAVSGRGNGTPQNGNRAHGGGGRFQGGPRPGQNRNQSGRGGSPNPFRGGQPRHGGKKGRG